MTQVWWRSRSSHVRPSIGLAANIVSLSSETLAEHARLLPVSAEVRDRWSQGVFNHDEVLDLHLRGRLVQITLDHQPVHTFFEEGAEWPDVHAEQEALLRSLMIREVAALFGNAAR